MARKLKVETHSFTKGQKLHLDEIFDVQGLAGGDWWSAADPSDASGDRGETVTITRNIMIRIEIY